VICLRHCSLTTALAEFSAFFCVYVATDHESSKDMREKQWRTTMIIMMERNNKRVAMEMMRVLLPSRIGIYGCLLGPLVGATVLLTYEQATWVGGGNGGC
jgi:hypothetical protein